MHVVVLTGGLVLLTLACVAVLLCPLQLPWWLPWTVWGVAAAALLGLTTLPLIARHPWLGERLHRLAVQVPQALSLGVRPAALGLSLVVQAANVLVVWLIGCAIGAPVPGSYYWILVPMVTLLTLLPVSLNGMGIREGGTVLFLAPLGVNEGTALSLAFLWFTVFTATALAGAGVYLLGPFPRPEGASAYGPVRGDSDQGRTGQYRAAA